MNITKSEIVAEPNDRPSMTVYFDGSCPICSREIEYYKRQRSAAPITWVDASSNLTEMPKALTRARALERFHIQLPDQTLVSGANAFAHLWWALPRFRILGAFARLPVVKTILEWGYGLLLILRPGLQKVVPSSKK